MPTAAAAVLFALGLRRRHTLRVCFEALRAHASQSIVAAQLKAAYQVCERHTLPAQLARLELEDELEAVISHRRREARNAAIRHARRLEHEIERSLLFRCFRALLIHKHVAHGPRVAHELTRSIATALKQRAAQVARALHPPPFTL